MGFLKPNLHVQDIYTIDLDSLWEAGYRGMLLDLDNTLVPYGEYDPIPEDAMKWLEKVKEKGFKYALYSNATKWKVDLIRKQTGMFCVHRAYKPWPLKLGPCMRNLDLPKAQVLTIGDQMFTDILGGNMSGIYTILVEPTHEKDFWGTKILRFMERCAGRKPLKG